MSVYLSRVKLSVDECQYISVRLSVDECQYISVEVGVRFKL